MRIVRIADLSEEERKKALEEQEERYQKNTAEREAEIQRVNKLFEEELNKQETLPTASNGYASKNKSFLEKLSYIGKNLNTGILSGTAGIAQSGLTDTANQMEKGSQKDIWSILGDSANALVGLVNPMQGINNTINKIPERVGNTLSTLTDKNKNAVEKITSIGLDVTNAPIEDNQYKNLLDVGSQIVGKINPNASNEILNINNKISEPLQKEQQKIIEEANEYDKVTQTLGGVAQVIGNMAPSIAVSALTRNPNAGLATMAMSAKGQSTQEALNKGVELDEAIKIGNTKAMIEVGTEMLTGGVNIFGKGALDDIVQRGIVDKVKNNIAKALVQQGVNISGEILEETISDILDTTIDKGTINPNTSYSINDWKDTALTTMLSTVVLNALTGGLGSVQNLKNNSTDLQQNQTNNSNILPTTQIIQEQNKMSKNQTSGQLNDILNNKELPMQSYQYELSDNAKINNLRQDANKYFNNSEKARNYVNMLEKIITDKNIDIRLDANLKTADGRIANGSYSNGVITINPNSTRAGEFIAIHELTHAIGTKEMINMINTYRNSNTEFDTAVKGLLQNYEGTEISEEALSDISAQLFGNQEFINNIAQNNPNIFQKLYSEIKYLWHQFRGYKNQDQFIEDLYYKWTQAYNNNTTNSKKSSYSIQADGNGNKYVKVDTDQDIFDGINENDYNKIAKMYMQDYLKGNTILNKNDKATIGSKGINKYTNPTQQTKYLSEKMQLTPELKNVLEIAEKVEDSPPTKDTSKYPNWEYYKFKFELGGKNFEGLINIGVDKNGNKHFYEINKIHTTSSSYVSTNKSSSMDSINNSIAPTKNDVNTTTKYSIQESENNSDSFNLQKNRFDVSGNENLVNAKTLFYRTREDGLYYVQATDGSGKITYDGVFYGEKQLARSLGEEIANKIVNTSENTNNEIYLQSDSVKNETDYMMAHRPTETGAYASNITKGTGEWESLMPEDVYEHPEWYFDMNQEYSKESFKILKQIKNNPNAEITIYRATTGNKINKGDWVTLSKKYAKYHNNSQFNGKGNIVELKVKAKDVQYAGDDINEFGYFPQVNTQTTDNPDIRYSKNNETWQSYLDKNYKATGTRTSMQDILPTAKAQNNTQNVAPTVENNVLPKAKRKLNPTEIANLTMNDANTTPILPQKNYTKGNKQSSFFRNVIEDAQFLNKDLRQEMSQDENIRYYKGITNAETLEKAYTDLQNGGQNETMRWFNKENKDISAEDIAKGWILLKQYQDSGDYQGAVEVAKKMRNMGTKAGQAVQAYNILSRLTPEGMFYYAQSELSEAYNKMAEGKSKEWIDDNRSKFDLTPEETQIIKEKMESIQGIEDERTKKIALAEIQKIITDKIPPTASQSIKSWMRISMLFNPKTQVRNIAGNAVILPVNMTSDFIASGVDKIISKKTGVRTTGNTNLKNYAKGFGKGLYESYDDFRKGINTRNIEGNKFEVTEGKNFKDKGIGKALNRVDNMLSFMLDAGDRGFYEATFTNSINNQLVLNNTTKVTPDMIDIATQEALQRTWQDNNTYTNAVLKIRKLLNFNKGYGLGDILIPFAKTPANLTKAIVDYSPVGLTKTLAVDARKLNNSLQNGQYTPQLQHKFVQDLGKGMAGTLLYVLGYALAKAGVITGEADEDKDVKNFMKNSLGINSYSIKIGDKSFTYDWAQPVATPFAIMANFEKYNRENPDASVIDKAINSINIGSEQLLQQSFMESINTVLNGNGTALENISQAILELPSRAVPTLSKQVADMIDGTQRTSFEYGKPVESAVNSVVAKIPGLSKTLAPSVDTLGNEIQKYGGDNGVWNVMFNPANMNKGKLSKAGEEIYNVYMETGDATLLPRTAPYYVDSKGEKKTMTSMQRSEFQKITGKYVESTINGLLNNKDYKKLSNDKKAELINEIVSDSYSKAKYDVLKIDSEQYEKLRNTLKSVSTTSYYDYKSKTEEEKKDNEKLEVLVDANYTEKEKQTLYENYIKSKTDEKYDIIKTVNNFNIESYLEYKLASSNGEFKADKKDDGTVSGKTISGSAKNKKFDYISNMKNTPYMQKAILFGLENTPNKSDKTTIVNYISSLPGKTNKEKLDMLDQFSWITIYKNGTIKY